MARSFSGRLCLLAHVDLWTGWQRLGPASCFLLRKALLGYPKPSRSQGKRLEGVSGVTLCYTCCAITFCVSLFAKASMSTYCVPGPGLVSMEEAEQGLLPPSRCLLSVGEMWTQEPECLGSCLLLSVCSWASC
jgi:hypothetical protein